MITQKKIVKLVLLVFFMMFGAFYSNTYAQKDFHCVEFSNLSYDGLNIAGILVGDNGMIYRSPDLGNTWNRIPIQMTNGINKITASDKNIIVAVGDIGTIIRSEDAGLTWTVLKTGFTNNLYGVEIAGNGRGFAIGAAGLILATQDHGLTWNVIMNPAKLSTPDLNSVSMYGNTPYGENDIGIIVGNTGKILYTNNGGKNWNPAELPYKEQSDFTYVTITDKYSAFATTRNGKIFQSVNGGKNWTLLYTTVKGYALNRVSLVGGRLIAVGYGGLEVISNFEDWREYATGTPNTLNCLHFINDNIGFAGGENGTFIKTNDGGGTWVPVKLVIPKEKEMDVNALLNYPNPFNPMTTIYYSIPFDSKVKIGIYDINGREVALLINGVKSAGKYMVQFDGSAYASGIYFCKIIAGNNTSSLKKTLKLVLSK